MQAFQLQAHPYLASARCFLLGKAGAAPIGGRGPVGLLHPVGTLGNRMHARRAALEVEERRPRPARIVEVHPEHQAAQLLR